MMDREKFIQRNRVEAELERRGVKVIGGGSQRMAKCPFHEDHNPSLSINVETGVWHCHAGCGGGSVFDLIAKYENTTVEDVMRRELGGGGGNGARAVYVPVRTGKTEPETLADNDPVEESVYSYRNEFGREVYQAVRYRPKTFKQRRMVDGKTVWNMEGVERVLYRLPEVLNAEEVWICEGEKDADNLSALGFCATTNVGGAGKWLDGYTEFLAGRKVVICGDNDEPGLAHVQTVFASISGKVKEAKIVSVPRPHKDVSDYIGAMGDKAAEGLASLRDAAIPFIKGVRLPIKAIVEIQDSYAKRCRSLGESGLDLGLWLPSLKKLRLVIPGEMVTIIGRTGVGKTALLSNLALAAAPMPTLFFQLELPQELLFERLMALRTKMACNFIERAYASGEKHGPEFFQKAFPGLFVCTEPRFNVEQIEATIYAAELKMGQKPVLVFVDYLGLVQGKGQSRYDRFSQIAEDLRLMAKATQTIVICASQVGRNPSGEDGEVTLYDAKESGSIENSSSLMLGAWRDERDEGTMHIKVLKGTKGGTGLKMVCNYNPDTLAITERETRRSPIGDYE